MLSVFVAVLDTPPTSECHPELVSGSQNSISFRTEMLNQVQHDEYLVYNSVFGIELSNNLLSRHSSAAADDTSYFVLLHSYF